MVFGQTNKLIFKLIPDNLSNSTQKRIALCLQYEGSSYCGWQRQSNALSVQEVLEDALESLNNKNPAITFAAGRTDAGVHTSGQVVHFDTNSSIPVTRWASALNGYLPSSIRVLDAASVPTNWHACYSAIHRRYRYTILNSQKSNLFLAPYTWHKYKERLDENIMRHSMLKLLGNHDFSSFQKTGSSRGHSWTTIQSINIRRNGEVITLDIQATGFLYGMVRLMVAQLVEVGAGKLSESEFEKRWKSRSRNDIKEAAPAQGLCLIQVGYPEKVFNTSFVDNKGDSLYPLSLMT